MDSLCLQPLFLRILYISGIILNIIRFVIPIVLIIRIVIDMYGHIVNPDDKDGLGKIKNRTIAAIIVFLTPTIIGVIYDFIEKNIVNNQYSDITVCREFANIEYIEAIENNMEEIENIKANDERNRNLSNFQRTVEAINDYVKNKNTDNSNSNFDNNTDDNNTQQDTSNLSGNMQIKKYSGWNYYLYVPDGATTSKKPLIIFLHGSGERGTKISNLDTHGFSKFINKKGKNYDAYILMPQLSSGSWDTSKIMELTRKVVNENNIDQSRISISGYSLGTAPLPSLIEKNPKYFSAVVFIALCSNIDSKANSFKATPTRLYYGSSDGTSCKPSYSKSFETALKKVNGNVKSFEKNATHSTIADVVLSDDSVVNWMTSQRR